MARPAAHEVRSVRVWLDGREETLPDPIVIEDPLEIRIAGPDGEATSFGITLRTPGHDDELALGLLWAEGVIEDPASLAAVEPYRDPRQPDAQGVTVRLGPGAVLDPAKWQRRLVVTSACGVCGRAALDAAMACSAGTLPPGPRLSPATILALPERMRVVQETFRKTGALHAAALATPEGEIVLVREDVGRHNAVDKVVGALLREGRLPAGPSVLVTSGRLGYEIVQKALRAGIPALCAVGAPTSLSVKLAERADMTLIGFARDGRFNVYAGAHRLDGFA